MSYFCPDCGGEMEYQGYRMLFLTCIECGETFHIDECETEE
ncbi:MAG: hypothetical protein ABEJ03_03585 [Candidatus Nanohaloarchaea archaeon]